MAQFNEYTADGTSRVFVYRFPAFEKADIQVSLNGIVQVSGWEPLGLGGGNGGAVEFTTAPADGVTVRIARLNIPPQVAYLVRDENLADIQDKGLARTNLGVYSTAQTDTAINAAAGTVQASNLQKAANLGDVADVAQARTNLGVEIGTDVQAHNADLDWVAANITAAGKAILDDADAAAQRTTLGAAAASHTHAAGDITSGTIDTARLGSGTANGATFLRGDQTWVAMSSGGAMEFVTSVSPSAAATVDFTGLVSGYDYIITAMNFSLSTEDGLVLRYGTGTTPTYQTSGYRSSAMRVGSSESVSGYSCDGQSYTSGIILQYDYNDNALASSLRIHVSNPGASSYHPCEFSGGGIRNWDNQYHFLHGIGWRETSEAVTALRLYCRRNSTITGTFLLYRVKLSA